MSEQPQQDQTAATNTSTAPTQQPFRFAVVGAGQIAQQAFIPGVQQLPEAQIVAFVSSDPEKARAYGVQHYDYEQYDELLNSGTIDGVYIATPVHKHREHAVPALKAGVPVLLEKPMAPSEEDCRAIIDAAAQTNTTLLVAYRLHNHPFLLRLVDCVRKKTIGEIRSYTASFGHNVNPENHRGNSGFWGGPIPDMGVYPLNLIRNLLEEEPIAVHAHGKRNADAQFDFHDTVAVTCEFPSGALAQYTASYSTVGQQGFTLAGSEGSIQSSAAFQWGDDAELSYTLAVEEDGEMSTETVEFEAYDQFAGETRHFIECVRNGTNPEHSGVEGLMDVRVCAAVEESLRTGATVRLEPVERRHRVSMDQAETIPAPPKPGDDELVNIVAEEL
ncbi:Gfo/Idh/MocA family protein [Corynebacterium heidelbergense]|uniref:Gfo/Idh/MocA family oxidoreductase n=1 Tax=Corynebacterium heidelbergense TaxID=2055947 RepID=A0A364V3I6_9CORY|nr:Gfo/Idh/MocA family oxidoreductase [Corynebacterium heidelbergense]RAV31191.1 gfo/Idh/MocA family oxidoreductase [Corynebacterium heidelbergense]